MLYDGILPHNRYIRLSLQSCCPPFHDCLKHLNGRTKYHGALEPSPILSLLCVVETSILRPSSTCYTCTSPSTVTPLTPTTRYIVDTASTVSPLHMMSAAGSERKILIIGTGGTIASEPTPNGYSPVSPLPLPCNGTSMLERIAGLCILDIA
jgi:hypothetical protein